MAAQTAQVIALLLARLLHQERSTALLAGPRHRPVPGRELAIRVPVASIERLAAPAAPLDQLAAAIGLGARNAQPDGPRVLALGIARAGDEAAKAPAAH